MDWLCLLLLLRCLCSWLRKWLCRRIVLMIVCGKLNVVV